MRVHETSGYDSNRGNGRCRAAGKMKCHTAAVGKSGYINAAALNRKVATDLCDNPVQECHIIDIPLRGSTATFTGIPVGPEAERTGLCIGINGDDFESIGNGIEVRLFANGFSIGAAAVEKNHEWKTGCPPESGSPPAFRDVHQESSLITGGADGMG